MMAALSMGGVHRKVFMTLGVSRQKQASGSVMWKKYFYKFWKIHSAVHESRVLL